MAAPSVSKTLDDDAPPRQRRTRRLRAAALALVGVVAAAVALAALLPSALRRAVIDQASARGIALDPGVIELELGALRLRNARFSLLGVRGLSGSAARATISLRGLAPARIAAQGVELSLVGTSALEDLPAWAARHRARLEELPLSATGVRVAWRERDGDAEALALAEASLALPGGGAAAPAPPGQAAPWTGVLRQARALVAGREVARADVAFSLGQAGMSLGLGAADVPSAPLAVDLHARPSPGATVHLAETPLPSLTALLGLEAFASPIKVAGKLDLRLPAGEARPSDAGASLEATFALAVKGFVLPHPRELDGLLFGDTTTIQGEARLLPDRERVALSHVSVSAGALQLAGAGAIQRDAADAGIDMDLSGAIPCSLLAGSAAMAHLGGPLGALAGTLAHRALAGSVAVRLRVSARASRLAAARVDPSAIVRCRARL